MTKLLFFLSAIPPLSIEKMLAGQKFDGKSPQLSIKLFKIMLSCQYDDSIGTIELSVFTMGIFKALEIQYVSDHFLQHGAKEIEGIDFAI